jgi:hypothetical protein
VRACPLCGRQIKDRAELCKWCLGPVPVFDPAAPQLPAVSTPGAVPPSTATVPLNPVANIASIGVGVVAGGAGAAVVYNFLLAVAWSSIHSGAGRRGGTEIKMALLSALAMALPTALGLSAGWATYRALSDKQAPE